MKYWPTSSELSSVLRASAVVCLLATLDLSAAARSGNVDYNRDIRPIFSENCYACHGPDQNKRKAGLRLDIKEDAYKQLKSDDYAIVPGNPKKSALIQRISTKDEDDLMPPPKTGKHLTKEQITLLRRWIEQGASWEGHWSYLKPERPTLPKVRNRRWTRNEIDHFILARLEKEGLKPSPEADRYTLIRRLSLDLTGLPPTLEEVDAFVKDSSPDAFDKLVDRLLASPAFGERMTQFWLDLARYADTNGYHIDNHRDMWLWREWVIQAFNDNMPFDRFTIEQFAGDMLPDATQRQKIASGFHRNGMVNFEGGADPDEYLTKYIVDRVSTTATVWLGTTMACAECHDHKYDPFSQKEFYQFYAFFHNVPEKGLDGSKENPVPSMKVTTPEQKTRWDDFKGRVGSLEADLKKELEPPHAERDTALAKWANELRTKALSSWTAVEPDAISSSGGATFTKLEDKSVLAGGDNADKDTYEIVLKTAESKVTGVRLEALTHESLPKNGASRSDNGNFVLSGFEVEAEAADPSSIPANQEPPVLSHWYALGPFKADTQQGAFGRKFIEEPHVDLTKSYNDGALKWTGQPEWKDEAVQKLTGDNSATYLYRTITVRESRLLLVSLGSDDGIQVWLNGQKILSNSASRGVAPDQEKAVLWLVAGTNQFLMKINNGEGDYGFYFAAKNEPVTNYPVQFASAVADFNQKDFKVDAALDDKPGTGWGVAGYEETNRLDRQALFIPRQPFGFPAGTTLKVRLKFESDHKRHAIGRFRLSTATEPAVTDFAGLPDNIQPILFADEGTRTPEQTTELTKYYRKTFVPEIKAINEDLTKTKDELEKFVASLPATMVMEEMEKPRDTFMLVRGNFQQKGNKVTANVPGVLPPLPEGQTANRLALALWLVSPEHPLTSRVTVNRFWQMLFGTGIVKTSNDFGSQGEWPSHPELLDWLATEFTARGWDVKQMIKLIVTSATYRQTAVTTPKLLEKDRYNRLLARGPRFRLDAEMIRDNALAVSGLLNRKIGGESVRPYQPPGLWEAVSFAAGFSSQNYVQSTGDDLYRRGIYVYWKRSLPYASFSTFDAPSREVCSVQRPRTSTPLQALALLNDTAYVEAARALAQRVIKDGGADLEQRLNYAFRLTLARAPRPNELQILKRIFHQQLENYRQDPEAAEALVKVGESPRLAELDASELAAWTAIGNILLNLDETITKG